MDTIPAYECKNRLVIFVYLLYTYPVIQMSYGIKNIYENGTRVEYS